MEWFNLQELESLMIFWENSLQSISPIKFSKAPQMKRTPLSIELSSGLYGFGLG